MKRKVLVFLLIICSKFSYAQLDSMSFIPEKDNSIYSELPNNSNGAGISLFSGKTKGKLGPAEIRRAFIKFNLSALPSNVQIQSVKLILAVTGAANLTSATRNFALHKVLKDWGEGTSSGTGLGAAATPNDVTWTKNFYNTSSWTNPGGDFTSTASAVSSITYLSFPLNFGIWNSVGMTNDVISWIANPSNNFGWIIIGEENVVGSAFYFGSKEGNFFDKPELRIYYTLPAVDKVLINEVNPQKKWVELYNPASTPVNLNNYWIANGVTTQSLTNCTVLNGDLQLHANNYVVLNCSGISQNNGELALFNGNPSTAEMKDYVQYGSGNQQRANAAVTAQVWDNVNNFLPAITADTLTHSVNGNNIYASGKTTNSSSFVVQRQTPTLRNLLCPPNLTLSGNIVEATYTTSGVFQVSGNVGNISTIKLQSASYVQLNPNALVDSGAKFQAQIGGCPNN
ncbi:MAG: DNRLRE domain-containing protein [Arcicella sp.]|jgi:hypothetical protein|nr:DNRLRE domain-containing protein [Arcicella sp.]